MAFPFSENTLTDLDFVSKYFGLTQQEMSRIKEIDYILLQSPHPHHGHSISVDTASHSLLSIMHRHRGACERIKIKKNKVRLERMTVKNEKKKDDIVRFVSKDKRLKAG